MPDLNFQDISTVQNNLQPAPKTIASAATIAPRGFLTFVTGTVAVANITPPVTGVHLLCLVFTAGTPVAFATTGNIQRAAVPLSNIPVFLVYDPAGKKYWAGAMA